MTELIERNDLIAELGNYIKKVEKDFPITMKEKRVPYHAFLDRILNFYFVTSFVSEKKIVSVDKRLRPLMFLYSKSSLSLFGIYSCLRNGLVSEAAPILRSLFESLINLEIILRVNPYQSPFYRMKLYYDYGHVIRWRSLQANRNLVKEGKLTQDKFDSQFKPELISKTEEYFNRVRSNYLDRKGKIKNWNWKIFESELGNKNPSIVFICSKLGRGVDYLTVYSTVSSLMHSSAIIEHMVSKGNVISLTPKFSRLIIDIGMVALHYSSEVVRHVINFLDLRSKRALDSFIESYVDAVLHDLSLDSFITEQRNK